MNIKLKDLLSKREILAISLSSPVLILIIAKEIFLDLKGKL